MDLFGLLAYLPPTMGAVSVVAQSGNLTRSARMRSALKDELQIVHSLPHGKSRRDLAGLVDEHVQGLVKHERRRRLKLPLAFAATFTMLVGLVALPGSSGWARGFAAFDLLVGAGALVFELARFTWSRASKSHDAQRSMSTNRA